MKYSYKFSDAIHILCYLNIYQDGELSSRAIAASIGSNPSIIRNLMSNMRDAGLITTQKGVAKPQLAKLPSKITLFNIYRAIEMDHDLLHIDPKVSSQSIVSDNIQEPLSYYYGKIQEAAYREMKQITLADIIDGILREDKV